MSRFRPLREPGELSVPQERRDDVGLVEVATKNGGLMEVSYGFITGWWFGTFLSYFSIQLGMENHPNWLLLHHFSEGLVVQPPARSCFRWFGRENHRFLWEFTLQYPLVNYYKNYGKSPCLMGKLTISMAIFNSKLLVYYWKLPLIVDLPSYKMVDLSVVFLYVYQRVTVMENR